nr:MULTISPECIES: FCD domain-containing protein [unclassified Acidovorax]
MWLKPNPPRGISPRASHSLGLAAPDGRARHHGRHADHQALVYTKTPDELVQSVRHHLDLVIAVRAKDNELARQAMQRYLPTGS